MQIDEEYPLEGTDMRTYIVKGNYTNRLDEALPLFEPQIKGSVTSQYAGFDPILGKEYTRHTFAPQSPGVTPKVWMHEGNSVNDSEADIIAAYAIAAASSRLQVSSYNYVPDAPDTLWDSEFGTIEDTSASSPVGGIDFNSANLNLQIRRDGEGVPLPLPQQNLKNIDLKGLYPVIINIMPINPQTLPILGQLAKT